MSVKRLIVVTPNCRLDALKIELEQKHYTSAAVCRIAHCKVCDDFGIKCAVIGDILPMNERYKIFNPIRRRISDLIFEGNSYVVPYPDQFPYQLNSISMINLHMNRRIIGRLYWRLFLAKLIKQFESFEWNVIGTNPTVDDIIEILKESNIHSNYIHLHNMGNNFSVRKNSTILEQLLNAMLMVPRLLLGKKNAQHKILILDQRTFRPIIESLYKGEASLVFGPTSLTNRYLAKHSWRLNSEILPITNLFSKVGDIDRKAAEITIAAARKIYRKEGDKESNVPVAEFWKTGWDYDNIIDENAIRLAFISNLWKRLDRLQPKVCISTGLFDTATIARLSWFKYHDFPTINMDVGIEMGGNPTPGAENSQYDYFFAAGPEFAKRKSAMDRGSTKYFVVGNPIYEEWMKREGGNSGNTVLIAPSSSGSDFSTDANDSFWTMIYRLIQKNESISFVIRPHALESESSVNSLLINEVISLPNSRLDKEVDNYVSLINSKLVITTWSTMALDSMVLQRPVVILNLADSNIGYKDYIPEQVVNNEKEFLTVFDKLLNDASFSKNALLKQKVFCDLFAGLHIDNVTDHIKKLLLKIAYDEPIDNIIQ